MSVDLKQLLPDYFVKSALIQDYISAINTLITSDDADSVMSLINGLDDLLNPNTVPIDYMQKLADMFFYEIKVLSVDTDATLRRQLLNIVPMLKIKGTYEALQYVAYMSGINILIKDYYWNGTISDYNNGNWYEADWFIGSTTENPTGLSASLKKSPHFGIYVLLNKYFGDFPNDYLWNSTLGTNFPSLVDYIRPVNSYPHYYLLMTPQTNESRTEVTMPGNIKTAVNGNWTYSNTYFDNSKLFDNGEIFDNSDTSFFNSVTRFKLGTGNKGVSPATSGFSLATPIYTGTCYPNTITESYVEYNLLVTPGTTLTGITELGLYTNTGTTLVAAATFPNVDISSDKTFLAKFRVNRGY